MTTTLSLNKACSRCPRVEQTPVSLEEAVKQAQKGQKSPKALVIMADGKELGSFEALCSICQAIVMKHVESSLKPQKHASSLRGASEGEG